MKARGGYGNVYGYGNGDGLSRTSVEEEPEEEPKEEGRASERRGWLRQRMAAMPEREYGAYFRVAQCYDVLIMVFALVKGETKDRDDSLPGGESGYGLSLWSRVATAASTLTINVSKAWASGISGHPGERASSFLFRALGI